MVATEVAEGTNSWDDVGVGRSDKRVYVGREYSDVVTYAVGVYWVAMKGTFVVRVIVR